jgi:hypothetical protein
MHPAYDRSTRENDVAILLLKASIDVNDFVRPICLWQDDYDMENIEGQNATVSAIKVAFYFVFNIPCAGFRLGIY